MPLLDTPWWRKAACRGHPLEWWYPAGMKGKAAEHLEAGKRICWQECPVRAECLLHAFETGEKYGTWGGLAGAQAGEQEQDTERGKERRNWQRRMQTAARQREAS